MAGTKNIYNKKQSTETVVHRRSYEKVFWKYAVNL